MIINFNISAEHPFYHGVWMGQRFEARPNFVQLMRRTVFLPPAVHWWSDRSGGLEMGGGVWMRGVNPFSSCYKTILCWIEYKAATQQNIPFLLIDDSVM